MDKGCPRVIDDRLDAVERAVDVLFESDLNAHDAHQLLLDLTALESEVQTTSAALEVLVKHLQAA